MGCISRGRCLFSATLVTYMVSPNDMMHLEVVTLPLGHYTKITDTEEHTLHSKTKVYNQNRSRCLTHVVVPKIDHA